MARRVTWLSFAGALGVLALSLIGLTVHELSTERVVHSLEVSGAQGDAKASRALLTI